MVLPKTSMKRSLGPRGQANQTAKSQQFKQKFQTTIPTVSLRRYNAVLTILHRFCTPTIPVLLLPVKIYPGIQMCWDCTRGVYLWSGGQAFSLPNLHQHSLHKFGSCHLKHLPSSAEIANTTAFTQPLFSFLTVDKQIN